jgi:hypothetical protein
MRVIRQLVWCVLFSAFCSGISFAQNQTSVGTDESRSLGDIARQYRQNKQANATPGEARAAHSLTSEEEQDRYEDEIKGLLQRRDFDGLEKTADSVRRNKSRFPGGVWKLYDFYEALQTPAGGRPGIRSRLECSPGGLETVRNVETPVRNRASSHGTGIS